MTLPKFLLAWADFNWLWLFAKLRPARDARWSFTRVLLLTAMKAAGGGLSGLFLALLIFRQPVGWLPWLLGLFAGCAGLCWFGVTAICWNQRAARLRANPALPKGLPKARLHFFRWCLGLVYFALIGIITPFALLVTVENIRAEIAWKRERARLVAAGEKLTFREIIGPKMPAAQNAGAAAVFAPFFDYRLRTLVRQENGKEVYNSGTVWGQSNQVERLQRIFHTPADYLSENPKGSRQNPATPKINITNWADAYRKLVEHPKQDDASWAAEIKLPPPGDPVRDVLAALSRAEEDLGEISAAAALPRSQFPVHYDEVFDALLPYLSVLKGAQQTLQLRCVAHLATGETDLAFADATNALNVAELLREEPLMISQLVRYAQTSVAVNTVWQGLAEHRWSDTQLAGFQRRLMKFDGAQSMVLMMEGERAFGIAGIESMISATQTYDDSILRTPAIFRTLRMIPRSMLRQNQTTIAHYETDALIHLRQGISNAPQPGLVAVVQSHAAKLENYVRRSYSPYTVMFDMLAPATGSAINKTARVETTVGLAIVACALERYRLAHGEFPDRLDQLSSQLEVSLPHDPMVNQPFHYSRTDDGWYLLYSVGLNGTDDGGVMRADKQKDEEDLDWPWPVPTRPMHPRLF